MARWAAKHRDSALLEARRREGWALLQQGLSGVEVARQLGVSRAAVSVWARRVGRGGERALAAKRRPGRPPRIAPGCQSELRTLIATPFGPSGSEREGWTLTRIALAVERTWGTRYSKSTIWRRLRAEGIVWQPRTARSSSVLVVGRDMLAVRPRADWSPGPVVQRFRTKVHGRSTPVKRRRTGRCGV
jgi:transposase